MIRIYRFAGDDPGALGGRVVLVIGDLVALDVGPDPSVVEALVAVTPGWELVDVGGLDALKVAIPRSLETAIADAVASGRAADITKIDAALRAVKR